MKAIGIARVSTKEQEEAGFSIPAQVSRIQEYASGKGFPDIEIHELAESSTKDTRKKFEKIIKDIQDSQECVALFVETIDRLQRDYKESVILDDLRKKGKVRIFFFRENLIIDQNSNSADIMRWDIGVFVAKQYVSQLRDNVKRSNERKLSEGEWTGKAPIGYLNINKDDGSISKKSEGRDCPKWIIPDQVRRHFVVRSFELFSTGLYSVQALAKDMTQEGFRTREGGKITKSTLHKMLSNPFYYGEMLCKGKLYTHKYEALIPYWLFENCQNVLQGRASNERGTQYNKKEFVFKDLVRCTACGNKLSSYTQKGINYIRCHTCKAVHEREDEFEKQIEGVFKKISIPEDIMLDIVQILNENHEKEQAYTKNQRNILLQDQSKIQSKMDLAYEDRLDGRITGNEYDKKVQELKKKDQDILEQLKDHSKGDEAFLISSSYILELAHNGYSLFKSITVNEYDKKVQELKRKEQDIYEQLKDHSKADEAFLISSSYILELAHNGYSLFKSSQTSKKREILNFVFANFQADGSKLLYKTKEPFGELLFCAESGKWLPFIDMFRRLSYQMYLLTALQMLFSLLVCQSPKKASCLS